MGEGGREREEREGKTKMVVEGGGVGGRNEFKVVLAKKWQIVYRVYLSARFEERQTDRQTETEREREKHREKKVT